MPELPEVETILKGIKPVVIKQTITEVIVRHPHLRWPIPKDLKEKLEGHVIKQLQRRGKYLLFTLDNGTLILHLGMSGRVCILSKSVPAKKHDHVDIYFANKKYLRFTDARRFGAILWADENPQQHPLLVNIGPEPLTAAFDGDYLWQRAQNKKVAVKSFLMDSKIVAGVGNIYAAEALFAAHILPQTPAGKISRINYRVLATAIKKVLEKALEKGGTTLKDYTKSDGSPGHFHHELKVYGRAGKPCMRCDTPLKLSQLGQRSTVYCEKCQR